MPAGGEWLTPTVEAYELAVKRQAFRRALRLDREPDTSAVLEYLRRLPQAEPVSPSSGGQKSTRGAARTG